MYLPLTKTAADELLESSLEKIYSNTNALEREKSRLLITLEELEEKCRIVCNAMYAEMGYTGGDLEANEKEFNERLKKAQEPVSFLNGEELNQLMIKELAAAKPYSKDYQKAYEELAKTATSKILVENLSKDEAILKYAKEFFKALGISEDKMKTLKISSDGTSVRGFGRKGTTPKLVLSNEFTQQRGVMRAALINYFKNKGIKPTQVDDNAVSFEYDDTYFYNLLKLSKTADKETKASLLDFNELEREGIFEGVKKTLKNKIMANMKDGSNKKEMNFAIEKVFERLKPKDLFAGSNAANKLTGLVGEIQAIYLLRIIIPNSKRITWSATSEKKGLQPHRDLILNLLQGHNYGIQVKNSVLSAELQAEKAITFQGFELKQIENIINGRLSFELPKVFIESSFDKDLYIAAATILAMDSFNVEYQWKKSGEKGVRGMAVKEDNAIFRPTREKIEKNVKEAKKAMQMFSAAMMFMQLSNETKLKDDSNALFLIGGKLAISSAAILSNIIKELESEIKSFQITSTLYSSDKKGENYTIVDYLNAAKGNHKSGKKIILQSSYNF